MFVQRVMVIVIVVKIEVEVEVELGSMVVVANKRKLRWH